MVVKGINFKSLPFAGFAAGYLMYFADNWLRGFIGLFGIFPGTSNAWWMLQHHIDGIMLALLFAWPAIYTNLPGRGWLKGLVFGFLWFIVLLIITWIAGSLGSKYLAQIPFTAAVIFSNLLLHLTYGFFLGVLYVPPKELASTV